MDTHPPDLLTTTEVARTLAVSRPTVHKLLDTGRLSGIRDGRLVRVSRSSLANYLETVRTGGGRA